MSEANGLRRRAIFLPYYPLILAVHPVLNTWSSNYRDVSGTDVAVVLIAALCASLVLLILLTAGTRSIARAAPLAGLIVLLFGSYGHFYSTLLAALHANLPAIEFRNAVNSNLHLLLSFFYLIIGIVLGRLLLRLQPARLRSFNTTAGIFTLLLLTVPLLSLLRSAIFEGRPTQETAVDTGVADEQREASDSRAPDIYYLVLDGYARADILKTYYDFDNSDFVSFLQNAGFSVAQRSRSNFDSTTRSLSSSLNMDYFESVKGKREGKSITKSRAVHLIRNNVVLRYLRSKGYRTIHLNSIWDVTRRNPFADQSVACPSPLVMSEFYRTLLEGTWLRVLESQLAAGIAECYLHQFAKLRHIAKEAGPKFVFGHIVLPHYPYVFDRNGRVLSDVAVSNQFKLMRILWGDKSKYIDQLIFLNTKLKDIVTAIQEDSIRPYLIILQSDHGTHLPGVSRPLEKQIRLANFTALYQNGAMSNGFSLPDDITPVNIFRYVFNEVFDAGLPILPNRHFYPKEESQILEEVVFSE